MKSLKICDLTLKQIASICDHTFLMPPQAFKNQGGNSVQKRAIAFKQFMQNSLKINPYAICVRSQDISQASKYLKQHSSAIVLAATVGFPDGNWYTTQYKVFQAEQALKQGAKQIDMVIKYKCTDQQIIKDCEAVKQMTHKYNGILKVILEVSQLSEQQIIKYSQMCNKLQVDFIKTSTGFGSSGADSKSLKLMKENFDKGIKISGGVNANNFKQLLSSANNNEQIQLDPLKIRIGQSSLLKLQ